MTKKNHRRKNNSKFVLGVGLIMVGLAAVLILLGPKHTEASQPVSRSVVPAEVNYPAPELSLQNVNGETESLVGYQDKVVLVNNWATWCPPCKAEIPTLEAYYKAHNEEGFVIIGIEAGEPQSEVLEFVQGSNITYPIWIDPENAGMQAFHSSGLPSSYVIDRNGAVRLAWVGEISQEMLEKYVTPMLIKK
jgi:thiol-disulfide isomerase/thioredoxin